MEIEQYIADHNQDAHESNRSYDNLEMKDISDIRENIISRIRQVNPIIGEGNMEVDTNGDGEKCEDDVKIVDVIIVEKNEQAQLLKAPLGARKRGKRREVTRKGENSRKELWFTSSR